MNPLERPLILWPISRSQTNLKKQCNKVSFSILNLPMYYNLYVWFSFHFSYIMLICVEFGTHKKYSIGADSAQRKTLNLFLAWMSPWHCPHLYYCAILDNSPFSYWALTGMFMSFTWPWLGSIKWNDINKHNYVYHLRVVCI